MALERDDPFLDLGYTSPEQASELHAARAAKAAGHIVRRAVRRPRYGRPRVGEDGRLLNVDTDPRTLTPQERAQANRVWAGREQDLYDDLYAQWQVALDAGDSYRAARLRSRMDQRDARQRELGRPPVQPTIPGLDIGSEDI